MKNLILAIVCLFSFGVSSQETFIEKYNLPLYDCQKDVVRMLEKRIVTIVVPDDSTGMLSEALWLEKDGKENKWFVSLKTESQLEDSDFENGLWILGPLDRYHNWERFSLPVHKSTNGFRIGEYEFTDPLHSFSYATDSLEIPLRLVVSGNSFEAYKQVNNMYCPGFKFVVLNNVVPVYIGLSTHLTDLDEIREKHYTKRESQYFTFMISKALSDEQLKGSEEKLKHYDDHAEAFSKKMELSLPDKKVLTYIHADQEEIKYMCGFFYTLCEGGGTVHGFVTGDEIHSWGFGGAVEHEANHNLFNQPLNKRPATFLSEGIQKWYEYSNDDKLKEAGRLKATEFIEEDLTDMICGRGMFFQGDKYYLISGIFVDYLMEKYGLDKFKEVFRYGTDDILNGFEKTYGKSLAQILDDYKEWLKIL